jgi:hypothetical protein
MTLIELLQQIFNATDEQTTAFTNGMKENKIFTASEENMDIRYGKLKGDNDNLTKQLGEATTTIEGLKKATKGHEEAQQKITAYEQQMAQLQAKLEATQFEAEAKVGLLAAKAVDVDYALYKLKEKMAADGKEQKVDENGKIPGWDDLLSSLQTEIPGHFETVDSNNGYKVLEPNKLKGGNGGESTVTKEQFMRMNYEERLALKQKNENLYNQLRK